MDKSWMLIQDRLFSPEFEAGVKLFMSLAEKNVDTRNMCRCPCRNCQNAFWKPLSVIERHIYRSGMSATYTRWIFHGEAGEYQEGNIPDQFDVHDMEEINDDDDMGPMIDDLARAAEFEEENEEMVGDSDRIDTFIGESGQKLYPGCKFSILEFIVRLMHVKVLSKWSNKSVDMILELMLQTWPESKLPESSYVAKRKLRDLGLGYETIHACKYDCALFWKENASAESCPVCNEPRYKVNDGKGKKIPHKSLRYFPVKPRLQRLFMSRHTATDMRWHKEKRVDNDGVLSHPADGEAWKSLDETYPQFSADARNVRLGLASDGFNPFGSMSLSYSLWPVILVPYNLPPWKLMKEPFRMLSLRIPGPTSPGKDIDVYLRPLVDELNDLWGFGAETFDAYTRKTFQMHAAILWTINDFPAYGILSGWSTHGYKACPVCSQDTSSKGITNKICYMGHRRYLQSNHRFRKSKLHDGKHELRPAPRVNSGEELLVQLEHVKNIKFGKHQSNKDYKRKRTSLESNWTKKSIFFELPYWSKLKIRHILDVMHIEKNICDNVLNTVLNIEGKTKDTVKARQDLEAMLIRPELHIQVDGQGRLIKPPATYTITTTERKQFLDFLTKVKFPDGYAANISKGVSIRDGKIFGMKSHDCHVMLQRLFPIGIRPYLKKDVCTALVELSNFFQQLTAKTLKLCDIDKLEENIIMILCKLERIFPPAFFDVMVHLAVHLPREARLAGPVGPRWMYGIERNLGTYKQYVTNKARPEGSIAEAYIVNESLTFCSMYLHGVETKFSRLERNDDRGDNTKGMSVFSQKARPIGGRERMELSKNELDKAHWYIVNNCVEIQPYLDEHMAQLELESPDLLYQRQQVSFCAWFAHRMKILRSQGAEEATDELYALACGPDTRVNTYTGCIVNGLRFHVKARDDRLRTQNSGVVVEGEHDDEVIDFYGVLSQVIVFDYLLDFRVVLFKCEWYDTDPKRKRLKIDYHFTSINCDRKWYSQDSFVLAHQALQVFYIDDPKCGAGWKVVQRVQHRHLWDITEKENDEIEGQNGSAEQEAYQQNQSSDLIWTVDQDFHVEMVEEEGDVDVDTTDENADLDDFVDDELIDDTIDEYFSDHEGNLQSDDDTDIEM